MKVILDEIKTGILNPSEKLRDKCAKRLGLSENKIDGIRILRRSIDAREKDNVKFVYMVEVELKKGASPKKRAGWRAAKQDERYDPAMLSDGKRKPGTRPIVCGSGPAGLFCAYILSINGLCPVIIERGSDADRRKEKVKRFWSGGPLDPETNVSFGEGGAGTFSDGKLNTRSKDREGRFDFILRTFVECGADSEITYDAAAHVGTDVLIEVIKNLRKKITDLGGTFFFDTRLCDVVCEDGRLKKIVTQNRGEMHTDTLILATGHSARDTFRMLLDRGIKMEQKPFAMGVRIEHPQRMIDIAQYGRFAADILPPAPYHLSGRTRSGRAVYSFCNCPGGYVVNSSSESGLVCVNGMSYSGRSSGVANSAIVAAVGADDFKGDGPLAGISLQMEIEKRAFEAAGGAIPCERFKDFSGANALRGFKDFSGAGASCGFKDFNPESMGARKFCDIGAILPQEVALAVREGIFLFGKKIKGFDDGGAILSAPETRTSSPVRILRDEGFESSIKGIYPCGEGAGYAGGIMTAAADGIKTAEAVIKNL